MSPISYNIHAFWDLEAEVWTVTSEDIPGLVTEANTLENLTAKLRILVPELLLLNQIIPDDQVTTIAMDIISHRQEMIEVAA